FNAHRERNNLAVQCVLAANLNRLIAGEDSSFSPVAGIGNRSAQPSIAAQGKDNVHVGLRSWEKSWGVAGVSAPRPIAPAYSTGAVRVKLAWNNSLSFLSCLCTT